VLLVDDEEDHIPCFPQVYIILKKKDIILRLSLILYQQQYYIEQIVVGFQVVLLAAGGLAIMTAYAGYLEALKVCMGVYGCLKRRICVYAYK
jgi:hypothetical protein